MEGKQTGQAGNFQPGRKAKHTSKEIIMSILQNLRGAIEIETKEQDAWLEDMNHLANNLGLTHNEMEEAANLLKQLKIEQARTNGIRRHRKLLIALSRYL